MGLFGGKKKLARSGVPDDYALAVQVQQAYWTYDADEQAELETVGVDALKWRQLLRLHHLLCMLRVSPGADIIAADEKIKRTLARMTGYKSPYRPRRAKFRLISDEKYEQGPEHKGFLWNPSITHIGCIEVLRINEQKEPTSVDFVSFDEMAYVEFEAGGLYRIATMSHDDERTVILPAAMIYGVTWTMGSEEEKAAQSSRFVAPLKEDKIGSLGSPGMGIGRVELALREDDGEGNLYPLATIDRIFFPLDPDDPRFDKKARRRGLDPDELRQKLSRHE